MHECPNCGQACDCDGEDVWNEVGSSDWENCVHECEDFEDDDWLMPDDDEDVPWCEKHQCHHELFDGSDDEREYYACPVCKREDADALYGNNYG